MTLETTLDTPTAPKWGKCQFRPWLDTLNESERNAVIRAFDNPAWTTSGIIEALHANGCPCSATTIRTHRKFACQSCNRKDGR